MITVCAWCQRFMGMKEPLSDPSLTHGICQTCTLRQQVGSFSTLVISRDRADALPFFRRLLRGIPEIQVVLDRREGERRQVRLAAQVREASTADERRLTNERRNALGLVLV
jgi:hypothetical protein